MEKIICPFCFDENIKHVSDVKIEGTDKSFSPSMNYLVQL
jgi:hypothetical protein